jgi:hypothetical protein
MKRECLRDTEVKSQRLHRKCYNIFGIVDVISRPCMPEYQPMRSALNRVKALWYLRVCAACPTFKELCVLPDVEDVRVP